MNQLYEGDDGNNNMHMGGRDDIVDQSPKDNLHNNSNEDDDEQQHYLYPQQLLDDGVVSRQQQYRLGDTSDHQNDHHYDIPVVHNSGNNMLIDRSNHDDEDDDDALLASIHDELSATMSDHHHHHNHHNYDHMTTRGGSGDDASSSHDPSWRLTNAVHMEIQENAKLPTFHMNVDRSGSSTTNKFDLSNIFQQFFHTATNTNTSANPMIQQRSSRSNTLTDDISVLGDSSLYQIEEDDHDSMLQINTDHDPQRQQQQSINLTELFLTSEKGLRHNNFPTHKSGRYMDINNSILSVQQQLPDEEDNAMHPDPPNMRYNITHDHLGQDVAISGAGDDGVDGLEIVVAGIDPTPLSEMKRKYSARHSTLGKSSNDMMMSNKMKPLVVNTSLPLQIQHQQTYWTRQEPLPIPSPAPLRNKVDITHANADLSGVANNDTEVVQSNPIPSSISFNALETKATLKNTNTQTPERSIKSTSSTTKLIGLRNTIEPPQHSIAHSISRPAVEVASQKRTQYGFGRKHVVPSVPTGATPIAANKKGSSATASKAATTTTTTRTYNRSSSVRSHTNSIKSTNGASSQTNNTTISKILPRAASTTMSNGDDDSGTGSVGGGSGSGGGYTNSLAGNVAYERKKERAKTARIRLNESIDRLQIALNMAGSQSKQRLVMFQEQTIPYRIITDCIKCADDAKKWDRPSFVGSAATMIQGLNAQCEALVRALHEERHLRAEQNIVSTSTTSAKSTVSKSIVQQHSPNLASGMKHTFPGNHLLSRTSSPTKVHDDIVLKRQKLSNGKGDQASEHISDKNIAGVDLPLTGSHYSNVCDAVITDVSILNRVAIFLDPLSIVRCMRVSRKWRNGGIFTSENIWQRLAIARFGSYNVRQWESKVEDLAHSNMHSSSNLYKTMDTLNIMPNCRLDGMLLLGESRLMRTISAWTYLVERSNGETIRSVKRPSNISGTGEYTSLPVVQLRIIIQNTGAQDDAITIREQKITVDSSTRRKGDEMVEIDWDDRFRKQVLNLDGSTHIPKTTCRGPIENQNIYRELCRLRLFDAVIIEINIHARGCTTTSKFVQKSNFTKILVQIRDGTTVPLVIPFPRDASHLLP